MAMKLFTYIEKNSMLVWSMIWAWWKWTMQILITWGRLGICVITYAKFKMKVKAFLVLYLKPPSHPWSIMYNNCFSMILCVKSMCLLCRKLVMITIVVKKIVYFGFPPLMLKSPYSPFNFDFMSNTHFVVCIDYMHAYIKNYFTPPNHAHNEHVLPQIAWVTK